MSAQFLVRKLKAFVTLWEDSRRQILAFFVSGNLADLHVYVLSALWWDSLLGASIQRGTLRVHDLNGLRKLAVFNANYLHHLYEAAL